MKVKVNDNVLVITGKYAGKQGKVIASSPKQGTVTVEGVNIHKKSKKARKANEVSKITEIEAPLNVSNVMVVCPSCSKAIRVKYNAEGDKKFRVCPKCGATLDKAYSGKATKSAKTEEAPKKRVRKRAKKEEAETVKSEAPAESSEE